MTQNESIEHREKNTNNICFMINNICSGIKNLYLKLISKKNKKIYPEENVLPNTHSETIIDWKSSNPTYGPYHWWPWKSYEKENYTKHLQNNLYAKGGALYKYDQIFCVKAVEYQKLNYFRSETSSLSDKDWAGFCDKAAILSCLWEYPKYGVDVKYNGKNAHFTPKDISALMTVICDNTIINKTSFYGERYDGLYNEDKNERLILNKIDKLIK